MADARAARARGGHVEQTEILICGAGPVGLTTSILLSRFGIKHILVEKRPNISTLPRARGITSRTVEIWAQFGLYDELTRLSLPADWCTRFIYADTMTGRLIGEMPSNSMAPGSVAAWTAYDFRCCAQDEIDSMLWRHAASYPQCEIRFGTEIVNHSQDADGVTVEVRSHDNGDSYSIRANWLIAADGGSSPLREHAGIKSAGAFNLKSYVNNHFTADLSRFTRGREAALIWTLGKGTEGVFQPLDGRKRWMTNIQFDPKTDPFESWTEGRVKARLRKMIGPGAESVDIDLHSSYPFTMSAMVAEKLFDRRLILVGDAAHKIPPFGGFGMNTGVQTAHNLVWKLAMIIAGKAPPALLDSYDVERREVARRVCEFGQVNAGYVNAIEHAPTPEAQRKAVAESRTYGNWVGLDLGVHYERAGAFVPDESPPPVWGHEITNYRPTAKPGYRAPHFWVHHHGRRLSVTDFFERNFVVLAAQEGTGWLEAAGRLTKSSGVAIDAYHVASNGDLRPEADFSALYEIGAGGAVLIRPDGHVAFRARERSEQADAALEAALSRGLYRDAPKAAQGDGRSDVGRTTARG
jgi:putative polyketide hydroxylase